MSGAGKRLGPAFVPLRAGSTGFWVQAKGSGPIEISVISPALGTTTIGLTAA